MASASLPVYIVQAFNSMATVADVAIVVDVGET